MKHFLLIITLLSGFSGFSQKFIANYDESKIPDYKLPYLLISKNGKQISTAKEWQKIRRKEILSDFETYVYGKIPKACFLGKFVATNGSGTVQSER